MKTSVLVFFAILLVFGLFSCKKDNPIPPEQQPQLNLTLEDVSCTEAWIKLTTANISLPADVELLKDGVHSETFSLTSTDTILYIDALLPNNSYSFTSIIQSSDRSITSPSLPVTTMDTTSHNFTWQTWTFGGDAGSCTLYDVAIINENDIWAVGEIYLLDSVGQPDPQLYNLMRWNGIRWSVDRIYYHQNGQSFLSSIKSIFAFNDADIWLGMDALLHYDGNNFQSKGISKAFQSWINKIWGTSSNDLYVVGDNGSIAHYQNGHWSRIESGTEANIGDIWGIPDGSGGYNKYLAADNSMLILDAGNNLQTVNADPGHSIASLWGKTTRLVYTAGGYGVSLYKNFNWDKPGGSDINTIYNIKGNAFNDVFGLSSTLSILHFNGFSWRYIIPSVNNIYYRQDSKDGIIAATGWQGEKAMITIIKKDN